MKKIELVKITDFYQKYKNLLPKVAIILAGIVIAFLTFLALYSFPNDELKAQGEERIKELNINFNSKILEELEAKQKPSEINGIGGRDPFAKL